MTRSARAIDYIKRLSGGYASNGIAIAIGSFMSFMQSASPQTAAEVDYRARIEAGESVYSTNCQTCHGDRLVNTGQTFDLRRLRAGDRARFDNAVRNGKNQMPPWKEVLSDEEIDQIWSYIRANAHQN